MKWINKYWQSKATEMEISNNSKNKIWHYIAYVWNKNKEKLAAEMWKAKVYGKPGYGQLFDWDKKQNRRNIKKKKRIE